MTQPPAVAKCLREGVCRVCGRPIIECAHLWSQAQGAKGYDNPELCVALCPKHHHLLDEGKLELLPYLTVYEQEAVVVAAGGIERAYKRLTYHDSRVRAIL